MLKRSDNLKDRFKIPTEVERWVFNSNDSNDIVNDPEDYDSIDDAYLDNYDPDEKKIKLTRKEQREKVVQILKQVRLKREAKLQQTNQFNKIISNMIEANDLNKQEKSMSELKLNDQIEDEETPQQPAEKKSKKFIESKKFKSVNSKISRAVPGSLQQNITIERTFFKDLLKLSKQRYLAKLNADFQKKRFTAAQARKGLYVEKESPFTTSSARSHSNIAFQAQIFPNKPNEIKRELKSISAFAKRRSDSILDDMNDKMKPIKSKSPDSDEDDDLNEINGNKKQTGRLDIRRRPNTTLALSHVDSSSRLSAHEVKLKLDENKYYLLNKKEPFMLLNPTSDDRFKGLISTMSSYKLNNKLSSQKPDLIVRNLISSNKALQRDGPPPKENDKKTSIVEMNMKLFERILSNIN